MFGYSTELRSCTEVSSTLKHPIRVCFINTDTTLPLSKHAAVSEYSYTEVLIETRMHQRLLILTSSTVVSVGKRGVHHGVQQVPALPAGHTGRPRPQVSGGNRAAAR